MISRNIIINIAREVGFDLVGVVAAQHLEEEHNRFNEWLLAGNGASLDYLSRNIEKRFDAQLLVEGSRSVIVCAISYLSPYSRGYSDDCHRWYGCSRRGPCKVSRTSISYPPSLWWRYVIHLCSDLRFRGIFRGTAALARGIFSIKL